MRTRNPRSYALTADLVASHAGGPVVCLDAGAIGRTYRLHPRRPGAETNVCAYAIEGGGIEWRVELDGPPAPLSLGVEEEKPPTLTRVDVRGPLLQRAAYEEPCGGWSDGHDAVCERLCAAFETGDVLLVMDSPGGACAGLQESVRRAQEMKAGLGRHVIVYADEMICSAALWWAACIADEIFIPPGGVIGSIGARGAHASIAGALAQEGVEVTYFCWPDDGKIALAPERPLSDVGRERGSRDVTIAGEAFAAAVASSLGLRTGLDVDAIRALRADALTGQAAVRAGLADGVASLEDVTEYALAIAAGADGEIMKLKAEGDEPEKDAEGDDNAPPPADKAECGGCHMANPSHAKYCLGCGSPMGAEEEDEPERDAEGDEGPPSSRKPPAGAKAKAEPPPPKEDASLAALLGCRDGASALALRTAAVKQRQVIDFAAKITGQSSMAGILGGLTALAEDASQSADLRAKLNGEQRRNHARERTDLLTKLAAAGLPGYQRGDLFVDDVTASGQRVGVRPAPVYAEMKLGTLRGLVEGKLANSGTAKRTPFDPDRKAAEAASKAVGGKTLDQRVEAAKGHPDVQRIFNRSGNELPLDAIAKSFVANNFDQQGAR